MVYVMLADGFEEVEAIEPIDILKRGGVDVTTVGVKSKTVSGAHGIEDDADIEINGVEPERNGTFNVAGRYRVMKFLTRQTTYTDF